MYLAVQKEGVVAGALGAAGQSADFGGLGKGEIQPHNQVLHRKGKGVGQQHELGFVGRGDAQEFLPGVGAGVEVGELFAVEVKGGKVDAGEGGRGDGYGGALLDFQSGADDAAAGTAESVIRGQQFGQSRTDASVAGLMVGGYESHRQLRRFAQLGADRFGALRQGGVKVGLLGYGGRPFHQAASYTIAMGDSLRWGMLLPV